MLISTSNHTLTLDAQASETRSLPVLQPTLPGSYSTHLEVNGRIYRTDNFLVAADGALFAVVQAEPSVALNQSAVITVEVQNELYSPIDADVMLALSSPDGQVITPALQQIATGKYQATYSPSMTGTFSINVSVAKPNYAGNSASAYFVVQDASLLMTGVEGQLTLDETTAMTLTVQNERGVPVQKATVIVSDTQGVLVATTDQAGKATLTIQASDTTPRMVTIEKLGFAVTSLQLPVKDSAGSRVPTLILSTPKVTNQSVLTVYGRTDPMANLSLQGQPVNVGSSGIFSAAIQLVEGDNTLSAVATNVAGLSTAVTKTITLDTIPPVLTIQTPIPGYTTSSPFVEFTGQVEPGSALLINGYPVNMLDNGSFKDIYASRRDGPYRLTNLVLTDQSAIPLVLAERTDAYITAGYRYTTFGDGKVYLPMVSR